MRLRTAIFVSALLRQVQAQGGFGAVLKKGNEEAGALHILMREEGGQCRHFAPASQADYESTAAGERLFEQRDSIADADLPAFLQSESRFDPDFWVVEVEPSGPTLPFEVVSDRAG